jgi:hypothetical protein
MDGLSFHPYPNSASDPLSRGYQWPNAGFANLDRIKQAVWDAFAGTAQPTTLDGMRLYLDEVGWQVDTAGRDGYTGEENVPVTDEDSQAAVYGALVRAAACDPDVAAVNLFGFRDDALRTGFQAGLYRADGSPRPALDAVRDAISDTAQGCAAPAAAWRPARAVLAARRPSVVIGRRAVSVELTAEEGASARACLLPGRHTPASARHLMSARRVAGGTCVAGVVSANRRTTLRLVRGAQQTLAVLVTAEANPGRANTVVRALASCLTPNTCSGTLRTDVRHVVSRSDSASRARGAVPLGALRG